MKWIKTTDRLPERVPNQRYSQVWCLCVYDREVQVLVFNHEHMCWDDRSGDDFFCQIGEVSHWIPLPPLPTADNVEGANLHPQKDKGSAVQLANTAICPKCGSEDIVEYIKPPVLYVCYSCHASWGE